MAFDGRDRFGRFVQAAVVPYGRGRIAVFSDSTLFSNFTLFASSQVDYALRTLDYLHRTPTNHRKILFMASLVLLGYGAKNRSLQRSVAWEE